MHGVERFNPFHITFLLKKKHPATILQQYPWFQWKLPTRTIVTTYMEADLHSFGKHSKASLQLERLLK